MLIDYSYFFMDYMITNDSHNGIKLFIIYLFSCSIICNNNVHVIAIFMFISVCTCDAGIPKLFCQSNWPKIFTWNPWDLKLIFQIINNICIFSDAG